MLHILTTLSLAFALVPANRPDILPEGMKGVRVETRIELGPIALTSCLEHVVVAGETLGAIAKSHLGDAKLFPAIAALNPGLDPDRLTVGQKLWLPPRGPLPDGQTPTFLFLDAARPAQVQVHPLADTLLLNPPPRYGRVALWLVPQAALAEFQGVLANRKTLRDGLEAMAKAGTVRRLEASTPGRLVERESPMHRRLDTLRVQPAGEAALELVLASSEGFDEQGRKLDAVAPAKAKTDKDGEALLLLLLAGGGLAGLGLLAARRRAPKLALA